MSKLSYTLSRNPDGTWRVEIPWNGRTSVHQTKTKDRVLAEQKAKFRLKRLPIEDKAHRKYRETQRRLRGAPAPKKSKPAAPPAIDPAETAAKLRALPLASGAGPTEPQDIPPGGQPTSAPETPHDTPPAAAGEPTPMPELPDAPTAPLRPDVGDDRPEEEDDTEGREFFSDVIAVAVVSGTVKTCVTWADKRDKVANDPHEKSLEWYTEGLQFRLRKLLGDSSLGPNAKLLIGGAGVIVSMLWGCKDKDPANTTQTSAPPPPRPPPATPSPQSDNGGDQGDDVDTGYDVADERVLVQQQQSNGTAAAGRFR